MAFDTHGASGKPWTGFDLDGTLAKYDKWRGVAHIGDPVKPMCDLIKELHGDGKDVKIVTARVAPREDGSHRLARAFISRWCRDNLGFVPPITHEKDALMETLYDDRVKAVEQNTGKVLNMAKFKVGDKVRIIGGGVETIASVYPKGRGTGFGPKEVDYYATRESDGFITDDDISGVANSCRSTNSIVAKAMNAVARNYDVKPGWTNRWSGELKPGTKITVVDSPMRYGGMAGEVVRRDGSRYVVRLDDIAGMEVQLNPNQISVKNADTSTVSEKAVNADKVIKEKSGLKLVQNPADGTYWVYLPNGGGIGYGTNLKEATQKFDLEARFRNSRAANAKWVILYRDGGKEKIEAPSHAEAKKIAEAKSKKSGRGYTSVIVDDGVDYDRWQFFNAKACNSTNAVVRKAMNAVDAQGHEHGSDGKFTSKGGGSKKDSKDFHSHIDSLAAKAASGEDGYEDPKTKRMRERLAKMREKNEALRKDNERRRAALVGKRAELDKMRAEVMKANVDKWKAAHKSKNAVVAKALNARALNYSPYRKGAWLHDDKGANYTVVEEEHWGKNGDAERFVTIRDEQTKQTKEVAVTELAHRFDFGEATNAARAKNADEYVIRKAFTPGKWFLERKTKSLGDAGSRKIFSSEDEARAYAKSNGLLVVNAVARDEATAKRDIEQSLRKMADFAAKFTGAKTTPSSALNDPMYSGYIELTFPTEEESANFNPYYLINKLGDDKSLLPRWAWGIYGFNNNRNGRTWRIMIGRFAT